MIKPGIIDSRPVKGDTVIVRATGRLENGKEVDVHDELTFTVGDSEVIFLNVCSVLFLYVHGCS